MKSAHLNDMMKGWFVGKFSPSILSTSDVEVAVKTYRAGDIEQLHHHRLAVEITVIISGNVVMAGKEWSDGDIILLEPGEATSFECLTDTTSVVVKMPSVADDKFPGYLT